MYLFSCTMVSKANHLEIVKNWNKGIGNIRKEVDEKVESTKQSWYDINDLWSYLPRNIQEIIPR